MSTIEEVEIPCMFCAGPLTAHERSGIPICERCGRGQIASQPKTYDCAICGGQVNLSSPIKPTASPGRGGKDPAGGTP